LFTKISLLILEFCFKFSVGMIMAVADSSGKSINTFSSPPPVKPQAVLNPYEQELQTLVRGKIDQTLFETSIRILVLTQDEVEANRRLSGLVSSLGPLSNSYQSLTTKRPFLKLP